MNRYSLRSDSRRWWWPAGAAGVAAAGVLTVSLLATPSTSSVGPQQVGELHRGYAHIPDHEVQRGYAHIPYDRCPPPPDPAYVGVPWAAHSDRCPTLAHWWTYVR